jgi:hypothetical protein
MVNENIMRIEKRIDASKPLDMNTIVEVSQVSTIFIYSIFYR